MEAKDTRTKKEKWWYEMGKLEGISEVVEWIKDSGDASLYTRGGEYTDEWQAKLKSWGIK